MSDLDEMLPDVFGELAERAPHDRDLAARVRRRARRGRGLLGAVAVCTAAAAIAALTWVATVPAARRSSTSQGVGIVPACHSPVVRGVLPEWARAGFTDPRPVMPYVRSAGGGILAILFGYPLTAPPRPDVSNKILWVWQQYPPTPNDVRLTARLDGTGPGVTKGLPNPVGPSGVDLPSPGCWRLTITWPGGSDTIDLQYVRP